MNTELKEFLHRYDIEKALDNDNNDFDYIYQEYEKFGATTRIRDLTQVFLKSNVYFLPYISKIYKGMFRGLDIKSIAIPNNIKIIADSSFLYCEALDSVTIGDSVTNIEKSAFDSCKSLESITIPSSVTNIEKFAFSGCKSLSSITLSDSLTTIAMFTFSDCTSLTSIKIPNSVTNIEAFAFSDCKSLSSIIYEDTKKKWEEIVKNKYWNRNVQIKFIHCTDGDIKIE